MYVACSDFNDKVLKCHLRYGLSEKLSCQLVIINLKNLSYYQLVQECQTQDNQLCATVIKTCKIMHRPQLSTKPSQQHTATRSQIIIPVTTSKPTTLDVNAINLTYSKLTACYGNRS